MTIANGWAVLVFVINFHNQQHNINKQVKQELNKHQQIVNLNNNSK